MADRKPEVRAASLQRWQDALFVVVGASLAVILALRLFGLAAGLPYYFAYDMDLVTSLDALYLHTQLLPDHLCHPGFGMNLVLWLGTAWLHAVGALSALSLVDVEDSLNPLAVMAEHADALRLFGPGAVLVTALLLTLALWRLLDLPRWPALAVLAVFGWQASSSHHAAMLRTECFAVLWWAAALWVAVEAARARRRWAAAALLVTTGLLLGLSFLSKVQGVFYLAAVPLLLVLARVRVGGWSAEWLDSARRRTAAVTTGISAFLFAGWLLLTRAAQRAEVPRGIMTWASGWGLTPLWWAVAGGVGGLLLAGGLLVVWPRARRALLPAQVACALIALGVLLSLSLHLLVYDDGALGWRYLLLDLKFALLRRTDLVQVPTLKQAWATLVAVVGAHPVRSSLQGGVVLGLGLARWRRWVDTRAWQLVLIGALPVLAVLQIAVATRLSNKDLVWQETLLNLGALVALGVLASDVSARRRPIRALAVAALLGLLGVNIQAGRQAHASMQRAGDYHWQDWVWQRGINHYDGNQKRYKGLMRRRYRDVADPAVREAARAHAFVLQMVRASVPELAVDLRSVGVLGPGYPALRSAIERQQGEGPRGWRGGALVDVTAALRSSGPRRLKVSKRADVDVLVLVDDAAWSAATARDVQPVADTLVLGPESSRQEFRGLLVTASATLTLAGQGPVLVALRWR